MPYKGKRKGTKSGGGPRKRAKCPKCNKLKKNCGCRY